MPDWLVVRRRGARESSLSREKCQVIPVCGAVNAGSAYCVASQCILCGAAIPDLWIYYEQQTLAW